MKYWSPPQLRVYKVTKTQLTQPVIPGHILLIVHRALEEAIEVSVQRQFPTISASQLAQVCQAVSDEWLRLLSESGGDEPLTLDTLNRSDFQTSHTLLWLAHHYASQLCRVPSEYWNAYGRQAVQHSVRLLIKRLRPLSSAYHRLFQHIQTITISPVTFTKIGTRRIVVEWRAETAVSALASDHQDMVVHDTVQLIAAAIRQTPELLGRKATIFTGDEHSDLRHEWSVAWQEDTTRRGNWGLWSGLALSLFLAFFLLFTGILSLFQILVVVPAIAGLVWKLVLRLRQYAGEQEYALQDVIQRTDDQVEMLQNLHQIDRELNAALSLDRVLSLWFDWAIRLTYADAGCIMLVDPSADMLQMARSYGYPPEMLTARLDKEQRLSWQQGVTGRAARTRNSFYVPDIREDAEYIAFSESTCSQLVVPVVSRERVLAVLTLEKNELDGFSTEEQVRVARLCDRASAALMNAILLRETEQEHQKLGAIIATTADAIIVTDLGGQLILVNTATMTHFGLENDWAAQELAVVFADTPLPNIFDQGKTMDGHAAGEIEYRETTFSVNMVSVQDVGYLLVLHDVTPFKELDNLKNELVATVSHDLKTPLSAIRGYLELIDLLEDLSKSGQEYLGRAKRSIGDMTQLIEDLLSVARLESGIDLERRPIYLKEVLQEIIEKYCLLIEEKQMQVALDVAPDIPHVLADGSRIRQILNNLIDNAIKYTPPAGQLLLSVKHNGEGARVAVRDTGLGIPDEALPTLFDKFSRVRDQRTEGIEGTGLGLYIVKKLVDAHGGKIWVDSVKGEGSTFYFTLPFA